MLLISLCFIDNTLILTSYIEDKWHATKKSCIFIFSVGFKLKKNCQMNFADFEFKFFWLRKTKGCLTVDTCKIQAAAV